MVVTVYSVVALQQGLFSVSFIQYFISVSSISAVQISYDPCFIHEEIMVYKVNHVLFQITALSLPNSSCFSFHLLSAPGRGLWIYCVNFLHLVLIRRRTWQKEKNKTQKIVGTIFIFYASPCLLLKISMSCLSTK